jgi:hypothetical protein
MFAYILGPVLFGWYGLFLGPLILVLVVHFVRLVLPELVTGKQLEPEALDPRVTITPDGDTQPPPGDADDVRDEPPAEETPADEPTDETTSDDPDGQSSR